MVILIGNRKGGVGKSTLTLILANFLAQQRYHNVTVLDMDHQQSLFAKSEKAKVLENEPLYAIVSIDRNSFSKVHQILERLSDEIVLVDLPGVMDDDNLIPLFSIANLIVCPFSFEEFSLDSTLLFAAIVRKINNRTPIVFVPNRIKHGVNYEMNIHAEKILHKFGMLSPALPDRIDFQRVSTYNTPSILNPIVSPFLDFLYQQYIIQI